MFCKYCGQYVANDFRFCPNCGSKLVKEDRIWKYFHKSQIITCSVLLLLYSIWFCIHLLLLICGEGMDGFYPNIRKGDIIWNIWNYGLPEFFFYVILFPLIILTIYVSIRLYGLYKKREKKREAKACDLYLEGVSYPEIMQQMHIKYSSRLYSYLYKGGAFNKKITPKRK